MGEDYSVLLFYHFTPLSDQAREVCWHRALCERLRLCGRLRVSPQGLNGTLSGSAAALGEYTCSVDARCPAEGQGIDWKFGPCEPSELFQELSVRAVREVVSLGVPLEDVPLGKAATHLSAAEFHERIATAAESGAVLLDVRNVYESRIGRFEAPGVETLCPPIRQFSELPAWLERMQPRLAGRPLLMYCTGGVRCEPASAWMRQRYDRGGGGGEGGGGGGGEGGGDGGGDGGGGEGGGGGGDGGGGKGGGGGDGGGGGAPSEVLQLHGGIHRYLEAFPDGGI